MKKGTPEGPLAAAKDPVVESEHKLLLESEPVAESRTLALRIHRSILRLAPGWIRDLKVEIRRGTIMLEGQCGSYYCKQLAQHAAMELAEGQQVDNRIEVA
jgi:hypothetical protein